MGRAVVTSPAGLVRLASWAAWERSPSLRETARRALRDRLPRLRPERAANDNDDDGGWVDGGQWR